jgi:UDP-N-acetyl-D-galactosamine dehydrogenase
VILAGRRINDNMGKFVGQKAVELIARIGIPLKRARVAVLGVTFKENVPDTRNSRVPDIVEELKRFGIEPFVHDPYADSEEIRHEYGFELCPWEELTDLDGMVLAVAHDEYRDMPCAELTKNLRPGGAFVDVKSMLDPACVRADLNYWSL